MNPVWLPWLAFEVKRRVRAGEVVVKILQSGAGSARDTHPVRCDAD